MRFLTGHNGIVTCIAWSPSGKFIATGSNDNTVAIWRVSDGKRVHILTGHTSGVSVVAWSPCSKFVVTGSTRHLEKGLVAIWRMSDGASMFVKKFGHRVVSVAWSPCGGFIACVSGCAWILRASDGNVVHKFGESHSVLCAAWSPQKCGKYLMTGMKDGTATVWCDGVCVRILKNKKESKPIVGVAWSPCGKLVVTCSLSKKTTRIKSLDLSPK